MREIYTDADTDLYLLSSNRRPLEEDLTSRYERQVTRATVLFLAVAHAASRRARGPALACAVPASN